MPGCVLRASGSGFDVDAFLADSPFKPTVIYKKGQRRRPASRGSHTVSGFNVVITNNEEPAKQVTAATKFLRENRDELLRLKKARGLESVTIDFGCAQKEFLARTAHLPAELLSAAGAFGIDIDVSFYLVG